jgi:hypothetical protein
MRNVTEVKRRPYWRPPCCTEKVRPRRPVRIKICHLPNSHYDFRCMGEIELLSEVAVLHDMPEKGLVRGQVGTVVELLAPSVAEVEFSDDQGRTYAMVSLRATK